jgi:hypothetical protein
MKPPSVQITELEATLAAREAEVGELKASLAWMTAERDHNLSLIVQDAKDWAETDTALRETCKPFVKNHEHVDGYRIPVEDVLTEAIATLTQERDAMKAAINYFFAVYDAATDNGKNPATQICFGKDVVDGLRSALSQPAGDGVGTEGGK